MGKTLVLAEPGCTAEGSYDTMLRLIHTAASCGADVFKPGWTSSAIRMCERRHIGVDHPKRAYYERAYGWLAYPAIWHEDFARLCKQLHLKYACTAYLPGDAVVLEPFVDYLKISSFEAQDIQLLETAIDVCGPQRVIVSLGMAAPAPLGVRWRLHCVSAYPCPIEALNLRCMVDVDGLSDHSRHVLTGAVAVGAGAQMIETHIRLDDCKPDNPDYAVAFTPREFAHYVHNIRLAEAMLGQGMLQVQESEKWALPYRTHGVPA